MDACLKVIRIGRQVDDYERLWTKALVHVCCTFLRRRKAEAVTGGFGDVAECDRGCDGGMNAAVDRIVLQRGLAALPDGQRRLLLRHAFGFSRSETIEGTSFSPDGLTMALGRWRKMLREALGE